MTNKEAIKKLKEILFMTGYEEAIDLAIKALEQQLECGCNTCEYYPMKDQRPQGEWKEGKNGTIKCNQCGCEIRYFYLIGNKPDFPKFCCDCGSIMKGGAE